jgi:hypothetical protein
MGTNVWEVDDWSMTEPIALKKAVLQEVMAMGKNIQKCKNEEQ